MQIKWYLRHKNNNIINDVDMDSKALEYIGYSLIYVLAISVLATVYSNLWFDK